MKGEFWANHDFLNDRVHHWGRNFNAYFLSKLGPKRTYQFEQSAEATLGNSQPVPSLKVEQGATGGTC